MKQLLDASLWLGLLCPVLIGVAWADAFTGLNTLGTFLAVFR